MKFVPLAGGLFDTEDEEQELAFRLAVEFFNRNQIMRQKPQLVAQVERIDTGDVYNATKKVCSLLEMGVAAIFGPQDYLTSLHVGSICDEMEVPHIETRWDYKNKRDDLSINLHPSASVLSDSYLAMVKHMEWQNFTLIYEGNYGITRLQNFLKEAEKNRWRIEIYNLEEDMPYRKVFWQVKKDLQKLKEENQKIVLDVGRENLFTVLKHAQQVGMITEHQQYLITSLDLHTLDLNEFKYGKCNITGFRLVQESYTEYKHLADFMARQYKYRRVQQHGIRASILNDSDRNCPDVRRSAHVYLGSPATGPGQGDPGLPIHLVQQQRQQRDRRHQPHQLHEIQQHDRNHRGIIFNGQGFRSVFQLDLVNLQEEGLIKFGEMLPGQIVNITKVLPLRCSSCRTNLHCYNHCGEALRDAEEFQQRTVWQ
ncbi:glutamate receptor ionotropic, kainate 2 [Caerostris extrusa]|uniref:Glutamate receptor ionotropic, kainate 2 n=1 Tax=Caerostris extrusa TaxID=172846 RepID=A0AAV4P2K6_CAEEX|nr:glutamate receptor ionotropic, kainate 2 [Caerostris extrusa]